MPNTRPGIVFDENGVCSACVSYESRKNVDWDMRWKQLEELCDKYRGLNGSGGFDCAIAVSGGKDSHFQIYIMKELMHMNPILFSVEDNFTMTEAGKHNLKNISDAFGCSVISFKPDIDAQRKLMRKTFERYGKPTWIVDRYIYVFPLIMAAKFNTPLIVYGENVGFEYGGYDSEETYSARGILKNGVASEIPCEELLGDGIEWEDLHFVYSLTEDELDLIDPVYLSYFLPWDGVKNYEVAKTRGFWNLSNEWNRTHHIENFNQIDSYGYIFNGWMKYPKYGHAQATDLASRFVRAGILARDEAVKIVNRTESDVDQKMMEDYRAFCGYSYKEFYSILDKWYNRDIFECDRFGRWSLKEPLR